MSVARIKEIVGLKCQTGNFKIGVREELIKNLLTWAASGSGARNHTTGNFKIGARGGLLPGYEGLIFYCCEKA